jgi:RNA polymerase sigma-70 factor (ECF subfamily)
VSVSTTHTASAAPTVSAPHDRTLSPADRRLFEELASRHYRQAFNIAYRIAGNQGRAEDLTQEAMVRAYQSFHCYRRELPFANWLYRIILNLQIDHVRRKPRVWIDSVEELPSVLELVDANSDPAELVLSQEIDTQIQKALMALPREFRRAVVLCDIEGLSYEEIAEAMGCSIGTVRSRIHRGRAQLRRLLGVTPG